MLVKVIYIYIVYAYDYTDSHTHTYTNSMTLGVVLSPLRGWDFRLPLLKHKTKQDQNYEYFSNIVYGIVCVCVWVSEWVGFTYKFIWMDGGWHKSLGRF